MQKKTVDQTKANVKSSIGLTPILNTLLIYFCI